MTIFMWGSWWFPGYDDDFMTIIQSWKNYDDDDNTAHHDQHCRYDDKYITINHHKNCHHHHQRGSALGASVRQKSTRSIWSTRLTVTHTSFARWVFLSDYGGDGDSCCLIIMVMIMMITMITMLIIMMTMINKTGCLSNCCDEIYSRVRMSTHFVYNIATFCLPKASSLSSPSPN